MRAESIEPLSVAEENSGQPILLRKRILKIIATARWRSVITVVIIVINFFVVYSSFALIGVFFPHEVGVD